MNLKLPIIKIINPRAQDKKNLGKKKKPFQALSPESLSEIKLALDKNKKIIIFINRRGLATSVICQDCGFVPKCPHCDIPLCFHLPSVLMCHHCGFQEVLPNTCPSCRGYRLKSLGIGMQRINEELKQFITPLPKVALIEAELSDELELEIFDKFNKGEIKILIGTEALLRPQIEKAELVIVASIDPLIFLPDYNSEERVFLNLLKLRKKTKEKLIIQTLIPENKIFQYLSKNQIEEFLREELEWRRNYFWPPFAQLIKLTFSHLDKNKGEKQAEIIRKKIDLAIIKLIPKKLQENFNILGPAPAFIFKEKGVFKWNILIKYKYNENQILQKINSIMELSLSTLLLSKNELDLRNKILKSLSLDKHWRIDIDPINTL